ncbi:MAG: pilus assembly protein N-terminal domain-containing protein [Tepidamorphaceae bacterium]|nr:pilus assembly protein N-terminal domain-containing protein [Rhodobiaceae bacterium]
MTASLKTARSLVAAMLVILPGALMSSQALAEKLLLGVDRAQLVRLDVPVDTVIIGNPTIADAAVYDQTTLIITGKSFGETNLIVLDSLGKIVHEADLAVSTPTDTLTIHKGPNRLSYTCAPVCERTLRAGDATEAFTNLQAQVAGTLDMGRAQAKQ